MIDTTGLGLNLRVAGCHQDELSAQIRSTNRRLHMFPVFQEEGWPSISLCAEMLMASLCEHHSDFLDVSLAHPHFYRSLSSMFGEGRLGHNADRLYNRFVTYPQVARKAAHNYDIFHICDHSYSHLLHSLPCSRTGVLVHDVDAFRCVLKGGCDRRPFWFRAMTRHILSGLRRAAIVFYTSDHVRQTISEFNLVDSGRLVKAPLGIAPEFVDNGPTALDCLPSLPRAPYLLHVGSCIPRKRIDILLDVFAQARRVVPELMLVKVGSDFAPAHRAMLRDLNVEQAVLPFTGLTRLQLAALYRSAAVTLVPSEREGFGLPVIEALACGSIVIANDIPPLREGGGDAAVYVPITNRQTWVDKVVSLVRDPDLAPSREARCRQGSRFNWRAHATVIATAYARLNDALGP